MSERELVIVGGGPAGLTAGLYAGRAKLDALLLERLSPGGQVLNTHWVENWPGDVEGVSGFDLSDRFRDHALKFGLAIQSAEVLGLRVEGERKIIATSEAYETKDSCMNGIESVKKNAPDAPVVEVKD